MASKKEKDIEKMNKSIEHLKRYSTEKLLHFLSLGSSVPLHIKRAYKAILKERGVKISLKNEA